MSQASPVLALNFVSLLIRVTARPVRKNSNPCWVAGHKTSLGRRHQCNQPRDLGRSAVCRRVTTHHTRDASAALAALRTAALHKEPFGLAIINRLLPDLTGTELTPAIESASDNSKTRIILLTSFDQNVAKIERNAETADQADKAVGIVAVRCGSECRCWSSSSFISQTLVGGSGRRLRTWAARGRQSC